MAKKLDQDSNRYSKVRDKWDYDEFLENEDYRTGWTSFDSLLYNRKNNLVVIHRRIN